MRTTIEIPEHYRSVLHTLAAKRGLRGYSAIIQEALDVYIERLSRKDDAKEDILRMMGTWQDDEVREVKERIKEMRKNWARS